MVKTIIRKWYDRLEFPRRFDRAFESALETISIDPGISIETYDLQCEDGKRNLLSFLYMCEATEEKYRELGIGEDILLATLRDIVRWTENWSLVKGELCLFELEWLSRHMKAQLFQLGRLQFYMAAAHEDIPRYGIHTGDNVVELHINRGEKLTPEAVDASMTRGRAFLQTYFPEFQYSVFTCQSWLLDETLKNYLPEGSNILRFGDRFDRIYAVESNFLIRFLFRWDTSEETLAREVCRTDFHRAVQKAILDGTRFHVVLGVIPKL